MLFILGCYRIGVWVVFFGIFGIFWNFFYLSVRVTGSPYEPHPCLDCTLTAAHFFKPYFIVSNLDIEDGGGSIIPFSSSPHIHSFILVV